MFDKAPLQSVSQRRATVLFSSKNLKGLIQCGTYISIMHCYCHLSCFGKCSFLLFFFFLKLMSSLLYLNRRSILRFSWCPMLHSSFFHVVLNMNELYWKLEISVLEREKKKKEQRCRFMSKKEVVKPHFLSFATMFQRGEEEGVWQCIFLKDCSKFVLNYYKFLLMGVNVEYWGCS